MTLLVSKTKIDKDMAQLLGRWRSDTDTMFRYLHPTPSRTHHQRFRPPHIFHAEYTLVPGQHVHCHCP